MTRATRHAARLQAQLLTCPSATTPDEVVDRLYSVQAQDPRGFRLAIRSRCTEPTAGDVDKALDSGRLIVSWLNRGTLHLVRAEDFWTLHHLTTPQLRTGSARRLRQEGVDDDQALRGIDVVAAALATGPQTRETLRGILDAAGVPTAGQALMHVLRATTLEGLAVRGPMRGNQQAFVDPSRWVGPSPDPADEGAALATVARRYLAGHGPAGPQDLARWAGIPLGRARSGFAAIADETESFGDAGERQLRGAERATDLPEPRLLGAFDPVLLGWTSRADIIGAHRGLVTMQRYLAAP